MEELPPASLWDGTREEELQAIFGEQRLLILALEEVLSHISFGPR